MSIVLDGTTGVTAPAFDGTLDATDLTGDVAAARITTALNATGTAPIFACRAFVNFNGTGTVAIRASGNVSSITDNGVGLYTVNFATAMPDADYAVVGTAMGTGSALDTRALSGGSAETQTTTGARVRTVNLNTSGAHGGGSDAPKVFVAIFR